LGVARALSQLVWLVAWLHSVFVYHVTTQKKQVIGEGLASKGDKADCNDLGMSSWVSFNLLYDLLFRYDTFRRRIFYAKRNKSNHTLV